jgi:serine/threonine protein kinase/Tfp pilus assembly protein PilF
LSQFGIQKVIDKKISHYKILEKIGEGGMGVVYKAEDTKLKRTVALKFLPQEFTRDKDAKERFIQEARAAAILDHPNICTVYEIDEVNGRTFIAMAYIKGQNLKDRLKSGFLKLEEALEIATKVAEGLQEAHNNGIIHRDIKPANIVITEKGQVKIMDFGLAKLSWGADLTKTATIMGTVAYMSPEQVKGEKIDHHTDIWSLGTMLYEMLSGELPFKSYHDQAVFFSILNETPDPIRKIRKDVSSELERIIQKSLEKDPTNRYSDMSAMLVALKSIGRKSISTPADKPSIAVLPFVNMSADPENEYFSDGLSEELINSLTKIKDLHVVARTSSFAFKGEKKDIRDIGQKLNVSTLLEGSVRKAGNRVRITAQLVKVEDGYHLWSERYDRSMEDVFAIQDEITEKIVDNLRTTLDIPSQIHEERHHENLEAYDLYLKGRYYWNKFSPEWTEKTIAYYEQAIEKDSKYAIAYAALAEAYVTLSIGFAILPSKDTMPKAREAAMRALELDPTLSEAHVSLGLVAACYDWDRKAAKQNFHKALELNPNSVSAHQWIEIYLTLLEGEYYESISHLERAQELDPLNLLVKTRLGFMYYYLRDFDHAIERFKEIVNFDPNYPLGHLGLVEGYGKKGMYDEAIAEGEEVLNLGMRADGAIGGLGFWYGITGKEDKALELLSELEGRSSKGYVSSFWIAAIYIGLKEMDKAFELLEKAYEERDGNLIYITVPSPFDALSPDPRYKKLLKKMGLGHLFEKLSSTKKQEINNGVRPS